MTRTKGICRFGDIIDSGVLKAVSNPQTRLVLAGDAILSGSGSDPDKDNYRNHWYSDTKLATKLGLGQRDGKKTNRMPARTNKRKPAAPGRQQVNQSQTFLKKKGIVERIQRKGTSTVTVLAEYETLCDIGQAHGGEVINLSPAPTPPGKPVQHFHDEALSSEKLAFLPGGASFLFLLYCRLVSTDKAAPDFACFNITQARAAAVLYIETITVRRQESILTRANLIVREGETVRIVAHTAEAIANRIVEYTAGEIASREPVRSFTQAAIERCQARRKSHKNEHGRDTPLNTVATPSPEHGRDTLLNTVATPPDHGRDTPLDHGRDIPPITVATQTTNEPLNRTTNGSITFNQRRKDRKADAEHLWEKVLNELALQMPATTFETWVRDTSIIYCTEDEFIVGAPHAWARDLLQSRLSKKIKHILDQLTGRSVQVSFEVRNQQQDRSDTVDVLQEEPAPEPAAEAAAIPSDTKPEVLDDAQDRIATQKARLIELVETRARDRYQYNQIIRAINAEIAAVDSEQLTAAEKVDRICELIARCIAILEDQPDPDLTAPNGNSRDTAGSAALVLADGAPAGNEQDQMSNTSLPRRAKKRFIPAEQIPVISTDKIPFASIAADWDEPWMVEAITEFERRIQPWLDLDTGGDPIRVETTYNPDRPHDMPHIINMKQAYALQQRFSAEQRAGAGLSDPLAPLIKAYLARPPAAGQH